MRLGAALAGAALLCGAGCATVSVYEPTTAEVSLSESQSRLQSAATDFCTAAREAEWAAGEASLGGLAGMFMGKEPAPSRYAQKIGAGSAPPLRVVAQVRSDALKARAGLDGVVDIAVGLLAATKPTREDVTQFERVLIHARQARESFAEAFLQVNARAGGGLDVPSELAALDAAMARARRTADDLAAARSAAPQA